MSTTTRSTSCADSARISSGGLPADPFESLRIHFGMLLGVDDFEVMQANQRGKTWLHSAWLHREGTVWGLQVVPEEPELRVARGLALDAAGRELHLERDVCLHLGRWLEEYGKDEGVPTDGTPFTAWVVLRSKDCLRRPVPALFDPCEGSGQTSAYSRIVETVEVRLVGAEPGPAPLPYRLLRVLFGLAAPEDPEEEVALAERGRILALPAEEQRAACLAAFRRFAAEDTMSLRPGTGADGAAAIHTPGSSEPGLVLARVDGVEARRQDGTWSVTVAAVDNDVRRAHVATSTIQELLCGPGCPPGGAPPPGGGPGPGPGSAPPELEDVSDAARVVRESFAAEDQTVGFELTRDLLTESVAPAAFEVSEFDRRKGWTRLEVAAADYVVEGNRVTLTLAAPLQDPYVRVIARGTGPTPLLDRRRYPIAGAVDDARPLNPHDGKDFVHMEKRA